MPVWGFIFGIVLFLPIEPPDRVGAHADADGPLMVLL